MPCPRYYLLPFLPLATKEQRCISRLLWFWHLRVDFTGRLSGREPSALLLALPVSPGVFWLNASCRAAAEMLSLSPPSPLCQSEHGTDGRAAQKQNFTPPACSSASVCCACVPHLQCFCGFPVHVRVSVQYVYVSLCTLPWLRLSHQWILLSGNPAKMCQVKLQESEQKETDWLHWIFMGAVVSCIVFNCLHASATGTYTMQQEGGGKHWHSYRNAWRTFWGQQWTQNNVDWPHYSHGDGAACYALNKKQKKQNKKIWNQLNYSGIHCTSATTSSAFQASIY